jgi:hypothetical protein
MKIRKEKEGKKYKMIMSEERKYEGERERGKIKPERENKNLRKF